MCYGAPRFVFTGPLKCSKESEVIATRILYSNKPLYTLNKYILFQELNETGSGKKVNYFKRKHNFKTQFEAKQPLKIEIKMVSFTDKGPGPVPPAKISES